MKLEILINDIQKGNLDKFSTDLEQYLAIEGHTIDDRDLFDFTLLDWATSAGKTEIMKFLFEQGASLYRGEDSDQTLLMHAAEGGKLETVRSLITQGYDIDLGVLGLEDQQRLQSLLDKKDVNDCTALIYALEKGNLEVAKWLIEQGASLEGVLAIYKQPLTPNGVNRRDLYVLLEQTERLLPFSAHRCNTAMQQRAESIGNQLRQLSKAFDNNAVEIVAGYLYRDTPLYTSFKSNLRTPNSKRASDKISKPVNRASKRVKNA